MIKNIFLTLATFGFLIAEADHIIFSRITTTPNDAEMVAIYNPTSVTINLSKYYLSDVSENITGSHYYNLPSGINCFPESGSDFIAQFPDINIDPNQTITIGLHDAISFKNYYSIDPDITLQEDMLSVDVDGSDSTIGSNSNLLIDNYESLILFYWDEGNSETVQDVDYFFWGTAQGAIAFYGVNKTGVDGYFDDTSFDIQAQNILEAHGEGQSYIRNSNDESGESNDNGNGITGDDETSEVFIESWSIITENGCFVPDCGCLIPEDPNYDESAQTSCLDANDNGYGDCCIANNITHTIEDIVMGSTEGFVATIRGTIIGFGDYREPNNGPQVIELLDSQTGHVIDLVIWDWDVITPTESSIAYMVDPSNLAEYVVLAEGLVGIYNGSFQFEITEESDISEYYVYYPQGEFIEDESINKVMISPAPFVIIPTLGERLDYSFSVPSNSKVVIRIFDMNGNFITSLLDDFFISSGTIERYEDKADWDGRDHHGQIVAPGTYLMHIEATNWQTGEYSYDMAPVVVGVYK
tara:strand:+ start:7570 stop:9147 length:1578 start_codon:yes stop_codon:yes gene_type:complete